MEVFRYAVSYGWSNADRSADYSASNGRAYAHRATDHRATRAIGANEHTDAYCLECRLYAGR